MANSNLTDAKSAKNDEFYTQYHDIEKEISGIISIKSGLGRFAGFARKKHPILPDFSRSYKIFVYWGGVR